MKNKTLLVVLIALVLWFSWMFRYDVVAHRAGIFVFDRWSGEFEEFSNFSQNIGLGR
ncbi:MAG: hypothetical protein PWQ57_3279 [Desulfovibrionales bacterium]|nr:hypothetical protein [Desulfovibrionales bacterium]